MRKLGFEGICIRFGSEVGARSGLAGLARRVVRVFGGDANRVREAVYHLPHACLSLVFVAVKPSLAEVLRYDDVSRELTPTGRDLCTLHLEDDASVGVRDCARTSLVNDCAQRVCPGHGESAGEAHAMR